MRSIFSNISVFDSILLFCLLIYITLLVDNVTNYVGEDLVTHPLVKFGILLLIFYYISTEEYVALVILFAYILTIHSYLSTNKNISKKNLFFEKKPIIVKKDNYMNINKIKSNKFIFPENSEKRNKNFTTELQFKDVQSNIFNEEAMNTEICIWNKGYSTQGIKNLV